MNKKFLINGGLFLASAAIILFAGDWALGILGFPSEVPQRVSHPANYEEVRRNIEFQYVFKTNNRGLRYRDISAEKPVNTYRVFVSGDSFTEGWGVNDGDRFTDLLENKFQSGEESIVFINGGLAGTGPLKYGKLFLEVGLEYKPDALLIALYVNDVANTPEILSSKPFSALPSRSSPRTGLKGIAHTLLPRIYIQLTLFVKGKVYRRGGAKADNFILRVSERARSQDIPQSQINRWKESLPQELVDANNQGTFNGSILSNGLLYPEYWTDSIDMSNTRGKNKWENTTNILAEIHERAKQNGVETAIVLIPTRFQYDPKSHRETNPWIIAGSEIRKEWLTEETEIQRRMRLWTLSEGVPFLDLTPVFRQAIKSNKSLNWELDGHWNPLGHQVAANAIASWLEDEHVFSFMKSKSLAIQ